MTIGASLCWQMEERKRCRDQDEVDVSTYEKAKLQKHISVQLIYNI